MNREVRAERVGQGASNFSILLQYNHTLSHTSPDLSTVVYGERQSGCDDVRLGLRAGLNHQNSTDIYAIEMTFENMTFES
jgi:hypothetical protein